MAHSAGPAPDDGIPGAGPPTSELPTFGLPTSGLPTSGHPAVNAAARIAAEDLAPHADAADDPARGVDPARLARIAAAGLQSVTIPVAEGGHGGSALVDAAVMNGG